MTQAYEVRQEVPGVTLPVGQAVYDQYKGSLAIPDGREARTHELALNGMRIRGRWHLVAMRLDYALGSGATYWMTFAWAGDA